MKRTIVALAALGMLATAGSVRAGQYANYNLYGTYVETFQGATAAGAPITGICQLTFDGSGLGGTGHLVLGTASNPASYCFTDNGIAAGECFQTFASGGYSVKSDGTGSITGTLATGTGCTSTTFSETLLIQSLGRGSLAENVLVARTDADAFAAGDLVPQGGGPFSNNALYGNYTESLGGTIGGNVFAGVCNDFFNGAGSVSGKCTLNTATIGSCQYALSGGYYVFGQGLFGPGGGLIYSANLTGTCGTIALGEFLKILNGSGYGGSFTAGQVAAVSYESGTIETGTYLLQN